MKAEEMPAAPPAALPQVDEGGEEKPSNPWPAALMGLLSLVTVADVFDDLRLGSDWLHLLLEAAVIAGTAAGAVYLWRLLVSERSRAHALKADLSASRADLERFRAESRDLMRGLSQVIDRQFDAWGLSPAEREVAVLLLKGLSHREAAEARRTSERTVRQQALAVYRKAGLAGRAELAAFFLEGLLLPGAEGRLGTAR